MPSTEETTAHLDFENLTGLQKAAIFILSLDEIAATAILKELEDREIQRISAWAARLGKVPQNIIEKVKNEFLFSTQSSKNILETGESKQAIKGLLGKVLSEERSKKIIDYIESGMEESEGLDSLHLLDHQTIVSYLVKEHPQTNAIILAHMDPNQASKVISNFEEDLQGEVMTRLANLERISPTIIRELNIILQEELLQQTEIKVSSVGGIDVTADILNALDHSTSTTIIEKIENSNPDLAENIRNQMFVFEDLINLDNRGMQTMMKEVSNDVLTLALKTASDEIKELIFSNISERAMEMIKEELEVMGPVRLSDVEHAQKEMVNIAQRLEEEGKITISGKGGNEILV